MDLGQALTSILKFLSDHEELIIVLLPILFGWFKTTRWGQRNQQAVILMADVAEKLKDQRIKDRVFIQADGAPPGVQDAIDHAVRVVDPNKKPRPLFERIVTEVCRGLMPRERQ